MARCKNVGGGLGDDDSHRPPRLSAEQKQRGKVLSMKKRKRLDPDTERAIAAAKAVERAERGGSRGALRIGEQLSPAQRHAVERAEAHHGGPPGTAMIGGHRYSLDDPAPGTTSSADTVEGATTQGEPQSQAKAQTQTESQTQTQLEQSLPLHRSTRARSSVSPRPKTQRRGARPPPRP